MGDGYGWGEEVSGSFFSFVFFFFLSESAARNHSALDDVHWWWLLEDLGNSKLVTLRYLLSTYFTV